MDAAEATFGCCPTPPTSKLAPEPTNRFPLHDTLDDQVSPSSGALSMSRPAAAVHRVIKAYDVRGLVGQEINESFVTDVGAAFARLMRGEDARQVAIGYDMRDSSPSLA